MAHTHTHAHTHKHTHRTLQLTLLVDTGRARRGIPAFLGSEQVRNREKVREREAGFIIKERERGNEVGLNE